MTLISSVQNIRILTEHDKDALQRMDTGIKDDYVIRIFPDLIKRENNVVYGLFEDDQLISVAGTTIFANKFAMLGRLRSDRRYLSKGNATKILDFIKKDLQRNPSVTWIGAHTQSSNEAAKKVVQHIDMPLFYTTHPLVLTKPELVEGTHGPVWEEIVTLEEKRNLLLSVEHTNPKIFPYEAYYPLPFDQALFTNDYLASCRMYRNPSNDRFVIIKDDQKGEFYAHVKYFWDDHYEQPGFWETVKQDLALDKDKFGAWVDFSPDAFARIPSLDPFQATEPWVLYGEWV